MAGDCFVKRKIREIVRLVVVYCLLHIAYEVSPTQKTIRRHFRIKLNNYMQSHGQNVTMHCCVEAVGTCNEH